jgi:pyridinium-3,5-bisthiocarboxylic acid mononucleotide nickel chelatase
MRTLYFDCFSGASGDMLLGALVDLGVSAGALEAKLAGLIEGVRLVQSRVERSSLSAVKIDVFAGGRGEGPDGRVEVLGGDVGHRPGPATRPHTHGRDSRGEHRHDHSDAHHHAPSSGHDVPRAHPHTDLHGEGSRSLAEIVQLIDRSGLSELTRRRATRAFCRLGEAEAKAHGTAPEQVHFHEVGAADAIVDVVGSMLAFEMLGIERFLCSPVNVGSGTVTFSHGTFPVPAPATAELLRGVPVYAGDVRKELTTPTGAAVISTVAEAYGPLTEMRVERIGYGAGGRDVPNHPNVLRLLLGETGEERPASQVAVVEAAVDDMTAEAIGYFTERALAEGALDVYTVPALMKKNRPGAAITLICDPGDLERMTRLVFAETTTLGLRHRLSDRRVLDRERVTVETAVGPLRVKLGRLGAEVLSASPEYDDCREAALRTGLPLKEVQAMAVAAYRAAAEKR